MSPKNVNSGEGEYKRREDAEGLTGTSGDRGTAEVVRPGTGC